MKVARRNLLLLGELATGQLNKTGDTITPIKNDTRDEFNCQYVVSRMKLCITLDQVVQISN
jgi:hypothetical protein